MIQGWPTLGYKKPPWQGGKAKLADVGNHMLGRQGSLSVRRMSGLLFVSVRQSRRSYLLHLYPQDGFLLVRGGFASVGEVDFAMGERGSPQAIFLAK